MAERSELLMCYRTPGGNLKYAFILNVAQYLQMTIRHLQAVENTLLHFVIK